jgi:hypothetical protein
VEPFREPPRLVERLVDIPPRIRETLGGTREAGRRLRELELDRERDEALLQPVVELALQAAPVGVDGADEPRARRAQLPELVAV